MLHNQAIFKVKTRIGLTLQVLGVLWIGGFLDNTIATYVDSHTARLVDYLALAIVIPLVLLLIGKNLLIRSKLRKHAANIATYAAAHKYSYTAGTHSRDQAQPYLATSLLLLKQRFYSMQNYVTAPNWRYVEFVFDIYRHIRVDYKDSFIYYALLQVELPRALPNIFFDSKKARGRQFRFKFARSQVVNLEGDFDKHFVTYAPPGYTQDMLAFISPEVMWALRHAAEYDIEISGNKLTLYAPIAVDAKQIDAMAAKAQTIKDKLLHNIVTYRDVRVPYAQGRRIVGGKGMALSRSVFFNRIAFVLLIAYVLINLVVALRD